MRSVPEQNWDGFVDTLLAGVHGVRQAGRKSWLLLPLLCLTLLMLPIGRSGPSDGGGVLAPLTVDSGSRDLFRLRPAADFFSVYDAGARILQGRDPYGVNEDTGREGVRAPYVATFRYLPITAFWLSVPLNLLPPWAAFYCWACLNIVFLVANFLLCVARRPDALLAFGVIWFAWFPVIAELHMGQFSLFMATMMLWGVDAMWRGRVFGALGWVLAVLLKVYPIAMAPTLFLWGWRKTVVATVLVVAVTTVAWRVVVPSGMDEGLVNRGVAGRVVGEMRVPYAGAMGSQALVNAVVWKAHGYTLNPGKKQDLPGSVFSDPVFLINGILLLAFGSVCLWALIATRNRRSLEAIGLFWMSWFFAYVDCWEHHYVFFQALLALLVMWRIVDVKTALFCWVFAGAPSLWYLWQKSGYSGNPIAELLGTAYFFQRPIALYILTAILVKRIWRGELTD